MKRMKSAIGISLVISLVIAILAVASLFVTQIEFAGRYKRTVISKNQAILDLGAANVDVVFEQGYRIANYFLLDNATCQFMYQSKVDEGSPAIQTLIDTIANVNNSKIINNGITEIFLYSAKSGYLVSSRNAFLNIEMAYPLFAFESYNARQWITKYLSAQVQNNLILPRTSVTIDGVKRNVIPIITGYPLNSLKQNDGKIVTLIDDDYIASLLSSLKLGQLGFAALIDRNGNMLSTYNRSDIPFAPDSGLKKNGATLTGTDGREYLILSSTAGKNNIRIVIGMELSEFEDFDHIQLIIAFSVLIALIILSLVYMMITLRRSNIPWKKLEQLADGSAPSYEDTVGYIEAISRQDDEELLEEGQRNLATETLFRRFIHERACQTEHLREGLFPSSSGSVTVALCRFCLIDDASHAAHEDINFLRLLVKKQLDEHFPGRYYFYMDLNYNLWAFVAERDEESLREKLDAVGQSIANLSPFGVLTVISSIQNGWENVKEMPRELNLFSPLLLENERWESRTFFYDDYRKTETDGYTPDKGTSERLAEAVISGKSGEVASELSKMLESIRTDNLSIASYGKMISTLTAAAIIWLGKSGRDISLFRSVDKTFSSLSEFLLKESGNQIGEKEKAEQKLVVEIGEYVKANYGRADLNLAVMASELHLRENYLYHFMNTRMGQSFSSYLEDFRMKEAARLFDSDSMIQVSDVAKACGYSNAQTFRRVFKKHFAVLPGDYRASRHI